MRTKVRDRLGETTENFFTNVSINEDINESIRTFAMEERWTYLQTVSTGTIASLSTAISTPLVNVDVSRQALLTIVPSTGTDTRIRIVRRVSLLQGVKLASRYSGSSTTGVEPQYYYLVSGSAPSGVETLVPRLVPAADKAYTYSYIYYRFPAGLSGDGDVPDVPTQYHEGLVARATALQWMKEMNGGPKSQEQMALYAEKLESARQDEQQLSLDEPLVWGGVDPEYRVEDTDSYMGVHLPPQLG